MCEVEPCVFWSSARRTKKLWGAASKASMLKCRARIRNDWNAEKFGEERDKRQLDAGEAGMQRGRTKEKEEEEEEGCEKPGRVEVLIIRLEVKSHLTGFPWIMAFTHSTVVQLLLSAII